MAAICFSDLRWWGLGGLIVCALANEGWSVRFWILRFTLIRWWRYAVTHHLLRLNILLPCARHCRMCDVFILLKRSCFFTVYLSRFGVLLTVFAGMIYRSKLNGMLKFWASCTGRRPLSVRFCCVIRFRYHPLCFCRLNSKVLLNNSDALGSRNFVLNFSDTL